MSVSYNLVLFDCTPDNLRELIWQLYGLASLGCFSVSSRETQTVPHTVCYTIHRRDNIMFQLFFYEVFHCKLMQGSCEKNVTILRKFRIAKESYFNQRERGEIKEFYYYRSFCLLVK